MPKDRNKRNPRKLLINMHGNIDKLNTYIPMLGKNEKSSRIPCSLLVYLTSYSLPFHLYNMITHGHKIEGFVSFLLHFLNKSWNFTISSIALWSNMLHDSMVDNFLHLIYRERSSIQVQDIRLPYYKMNLMKGVKNIIYLSLAILSTSRCFLNKLPPILILQLCKVQGDYKNHYLYDFTSILTPNNIITTMCVNSFPIDHTHEDIDGTYGRLSA